MLVKNNSDCPLIYNEKRWDPGTCIEVSDKEGEQFKLKGFEVIDSSKPKQVEEPKQEDEGSEES